MGNCRKECIFLWFIENYSYCWQKNGEKLVSPKFTANGFEDTVWFLRLYPRGNGKEAEGYISLFLTRSDNDDEGPEDFPVKYELSVLEADGRSRRLEGEHAFPKGNGHGWFKFRQMNEVLKHRKIHYLPQDTLSLRCKMWIGEGIAQEVTEITARTIIGIEEISYLHLTERFSRLEPSEKKTVQIKSPEKDRSIASSLYFIDYSCEGKMMVEITPSGKSQILAKFKVSLLDKSGKKIECCEADSRLDATRKDIQNLSLSLTRQAILNGKNDYLPDDNLALLCECVFSTGEVYAKVERRLYANKLVAFTQINNKAHSKDIYDAAKKLSECSNAMDDLKAIYDNQLLTDVELKTETKSFPAHKIWLCARSPFFKTMLTNALIENSKIISTDDLKDDTVQQLLLFLYTDKLDTLSWESAIKLYRTGVKYQIERLKVISASFLLDNVSAASAGELLILADTHNDCDLKQAVENFIFNNENQVFGSEEWEKLTEGNCKLALKTMLLKYKLNLMAISYPEARQSGHSDCAANSQA